MLTFLILGILLNILWPLFDGRKKLLLGQGIACYCFSGYFYTLAEPSLVGGHMNIIAGTQCLIAIPFGRYPKFRYLFLATIPVLIFIVIQGFSHYTGTAQTIAAIASASALALQCYGRFQMNPMMLRWLVLFSIPCWSIHNILMHAYPALISDTFVITSSYIGIRKAKKAQQRRQDQQPTQPQQPTT